MKRSILIPAAVIGMITILFCGCGNQTSVKSAAVEVHVTALGLSSQSKAKTVEASFLKLPGVDSVKANWISKDIYVKVDTTQTPYSRLVDMISELGFDILPDENM